MHVRAHPGTRFVLRSGCGRRMRSSLERERVMRRDDGSSKRFASTWRPVRGMRDLFDRDCRDHRFIEAEARKVARKYGYDEVMTPILERTGVFSRTLGDSSDVVGKEMYTFTDKSEESLSLRPENTAGIVRAILHSRTERIRSRPEKLFYCGPMFRRERPQKGRLRQFHQIGAELCGSNQAASDVEIIALGATFLEQVGLSAGPQGVLELQLNTLGDAESRAAYESLLVEHFESRRSELSSLSQARLDRGAVLRILDSKSEADRAAIDSAPGADTCRTLSATDRFEEVCEGVRDAQIPFVLNPRLVRGLDYYTHTAFEFVVSESAGGVGSVGQAILAGGRYDGLPRLLGAKNDIGAVGWACGLERVQLLLRDLDRGEGSAMPRVPSIVVAAVQPSKESDVTPHELHRYVDRVCRRLRASESPDWAVHRQFEIASMAKHYKQATKLYDADALVIVGEKEIRAGDGGFVSIKNFERNTLQTDVSLGSMTGLLADALYRG